MLTDRDYTPRQENPEETSRLSETFYQLPCTPWAFVVISKNLKDLLLDMTL